MISRIEDSPSRKMHGRIFFRTDGNINIGIGRLIRCTAIAEMLCNDFECVLAIQNPEPTVLQLTGNVFHHIISLPASEKYDGEELLPHLNEGDMVVLDGFHFNSEYQKKIKTRCRVVSIDDLHGEHFFSDVIINQSEGVMPSDYSSEEETRFYLGSRYALLRKNFIQSAIENRIIPTERKAIISMGATDIHNNSLKVLAALCKTEIMDEVEVVVSNLNKNISSLEKFIHSEKRMKILLCRNISASEIADVMKTCRVMICPANNTLLESCAIGMQIITGIASDYQKGILHGMISKEVADTCGNFLDATQEELTSRFELLLHDSSKAEEQLIKQRELIDGKSPERILEIFSKL